MEITDRWNLPPQLAVRLPPLFADALISAIIFLAARACNPSVAPRLAWIYALNPITVMIASHHGQFDSLAYLPAILAIWLSLASPSILRLYGSALLIGIGGALKVTPAFLFPAWVPEFSRKNGLWAFALLAALPLTAAFLLGWHMAPHEFVQNVIGYRTHAEGGWGYNFATLILGHIARLLHLETLSSFLHSVRSLHQYILIACIILTSWLVREKVFIERVFLIQLSVQLFAGRWAHEYTAWIVPLAILSNQRGILPWGLLTVAWMIIAYVGFVTTGTLQDNLFRAATIVGFLSWSALGLWFMSNLSKSRCAWLNWFSSPLLHK
ncbi:MAG: hypothetical protein NZL91_09345 [Thermoflexales bacterium]|nr:hypothetical protein [Thermoflexales bacterium]